MPRDHKLKKILYISGTRADFGLMTPVLKEIEKSSSLSLILGATGMHLMPKFGLTINEMKRIFKNVRSINTTFDNTHFASLASFIGPYMTKVVPFIKNSKPDFILTLGDRVEMLCSAMAAVYLGIPTGQLHGGEITSTVDEISRHAITKLSHLHFPATTEAARRIRLMGEEPWRIHAVGAPALDIILDSQLPTRQKLFSYLNIQKNQEIILVVQHPVSNKISFGRQIRETLMAVKSTKMPTVIIYPNADPGGQEIIAELNKHQNNPQFRIFPSLPYPMFLALERESAVWIGNSSAAMIESSSFKIPVVNIGERQAGRLHGHNVINAPYNHRKIYSAIRKSLFDNNYRKKLSHIKNPWGDGQTGKRIVRILENLVINQKLLNKRLTYD